MIQCDHCKKEKDNCKTDLEAYNYCLECIDSVPLILCTGCECYIEKSDMSKGSVFGKVCKNCHNMFVEREGL